MAAAGCSERKTATQVMLMITADDALSARVASVRVQVPDGMPEPLDQVLNLEGRDIRPDQNPLRVPLFPVDRDASRRYDVTVQLLDADDNRLGEQTLSGTYVENEFRHVWAFFDEVCETSHCPDGYRCQQGDCVEHCVSPEPVGQTVRSPPVACDEPCQAAGCFDDRDIAECDNGARKLVRRCGFGCADATTCTQIVPSNVPDPEFAQGLRDLVLEPGDAFLYTVAGTGLVVANGEVICPTGCDGVGCTEPCDPVLHGVGFETVDGGEGCDGEASSLAVFTLRRLHLLPSADLWIVGDRAVVLLVDEEVIIEGTVDVSANDEAPGPGGCPGAVEPHSSAIGVGGGAGLDGVAGGGGSFGGFGGAGGDLGSAEGGGALAGSVYGADFSTLVGGSGGGKGAANETTGPQSGGGHGGGALQISTNGRILFGPDGSIVSAGSGGFAGQVFGSGGGSGGAVWLEAGELACLPDARDEPHVGAPGGGGGTGSNQEFFAMNKGDTGDLHLDPADGGAPTGGAGSGLDGNAAAGRSPQAGGALAGQGLAGGGGGGAGRIRIGTLPVMDADAYQQACGPLLEPTSFGAATTD